MPLRLTNNRDIHLAQEWVVQLHAWIALHGLRGHDPFDIKAHPFIGRVQHRPLLRKASTALCDLFPNWSRRLLRIRPTTNPKALALTALGHLRLFQITEDSLHLDNGVACLHALEQKALASYSGLCWGYPFAVRAAGLACPAETPVGVVSAIAGDAFLLAHEITGETAFLDTAWSIAEFLRQDLPRIACGDQGWCFGYTPLDKRRVHNANLLAIEHILRTAQRVGRDACMEELAPALAFTLSAQRDDGAWPYGACSKDESYEPGLMNLVDHHHTGFVLRSLHGIQGVRPSEPVKEALRLGYRFYKSLIRPNGMPINAYGAWPVDIHACAEGILCNSVVATALPGAETRAVMVLQWTHSHLRNNQGGAPWYRKYPLLTSRIVFPRWGVAWMYRALAEYLYVLRSKF